MKYLTKCEVANLLRVSVRTISDYMRKGLLPPPRRLGRKLLWVDTELMTWIDAISNAPSLVGPHATPKRGRPRKLIVP